MKFRYINKERILVLILAIGLITVSVLSQPSTYMPGIVQPYSYIIYHEGTNFYAKNHYGQVDYSGNNALTVMQNAVDDLTEGGSVLVKNGEYPLELVTEGSNTYGLVLNHSEISFICESGAWLKVPNNSPATGASLNYGVLMLSWDQKHCDNIYVKVNINGNKANQINDQNLIVICRTGKQATIEDSRLENSSGYGIWGMSSSEIVIRNNLIQNCDQAGVHIESGTGINPIVTLEGNKALNCATGYFVTGGTTNPLLRLIVTNNVGKNSFDQHGIYISDYVENAKVTGNDFSGNNLTGVRAGNNGLKYIVLDNNICNNNGVGGIWVECGAGPIYGEQVEISNNICFNNTGFGIQSHKVNRLLISDNICANNTERGVSFSETKYQNVHGNTVTFSKYGIFDTGQSVQNGSKITDNHCVNNTVYDFYIEDSVDYAFISINYIGTMYLNHTLDTCDYNYIFGNYIQNLTQSAGSPTGNVYTDNYPDNTP